MNNLLFAILLTCGICLATDPHSNTSREYCHNEAFSPNCSSGHVIMMTSARYGRMSLGHCVKRDYGYVGCYADVLTVMDRRCSGRRTCRMYIPDPMLDAKSSCPADLKSYLEASYTCLPVAGPLFHLCERASYIKVQAGESVGYIANTVTEETRGCGSVKTPWLIEAPEGSRINITLYDFAVDEQLATASHRICRVYARISEGRQHQRELTVCGGIRHWRSVYISRGNSVELTILKQNRIRDDEKRFFVVGYQAYHDGVIDIEKQWENEWQNKQQVKRVFDCKNLNEKCKGVVPCCGTYQCYWPDGYSAFKSGRCVECVRQNQKCQRDSQCCSPLVCHKGARLHVDGQCGQKRYTGQECHEDDQCRSGDCQMSWGQKIKGYGGHCT